MSKVNVTSSEFCDLIIAFLLDKCLHSDEVAYGNKDFDKFIVKIIGKGLKSLLLQYYLNMDSSIRVKYKRLRSTIVGGAEETIILVKPPTDHKVEVEKKKDSLIKRIIKKLIRKESLDQDEINTIENILIEDKEDN
uniref:Uncharacterized protein n=1 Tax=viral metagenome TaxID=1070528 RepID=A0A6M3JJW0_9ZZZZ